MGKGKASAVHFRLTVCKLHQRVMPFPEQPLYADQLLVHEWYLRPVDICVHIFPYAAFASVCPDMEISCSFVKWCLKPVDICISV